MTQSGTEGPLAMAGGPFSLMRELHAGHLGSATILLADDNEDSREIYRTLFEMAGYRVMVAGDGRTVLTLVEGEKPDLILLNLLMPELDGHGVLVVVGEQDRDHALDHHHVRRVLGGLFPSGRIDGPVEDEAVASDREGVTVGQRHGGRDRDSVSRGAVAAAVIREIVVSRLLALHQCVLAGHHGIAVEDHRALRAASYAQARHVSQIERVILATDNNVDVRPLMVVRRGHSRLPRRYF
jgi:hypothetical protein